MLGGTKNIRILYCFNVNDALGKNYYHQKLLPSSFPVWERVLKYASVAKMQKPPKDCFSRHRRDRNDSVLSLSLRGSREAGDAAISF